MKNNIRISYLLFLLIQGTSVSFSQNVQQGIYLSAQDFDNNKISLSPLVEEKYKICLNEVFNQSQLKIIKGDSTYYFKKDSIFGYRDKDNIPFRLYERSSYQILNPEEKIIIYKQTSQGGNKNLQTIVKYYFSSSLMAPIYQLTKWNLKQNFPTDSTFHEFLDMYFRDDQELINYDSYYKMYKINRVYQFSEQMELNK